MPAVSVRLPFADLERHDGIRADPVSDKPGGRQRWAHLGRQLGIGELFTVVGLVLLAAVLRGFYLWDIPRFTDEVREAQIGLSIARGEALPLTNWDPYIGALWNYLLALFFLIGGPSIYAPRAVVMVAGALTVVPAYLLGKSIGGVRVGVLTAILLSSAPVHIAINSHIAWSNCLTPLLTTTGFWLFHGAVSAGRPGLLVWSGASFGLALQTHPSVAMLLPGAVLYGVLTRRSWLRSPWPYLALALGLVAYANVLVEGVRTDWNVVNAAGRVQAQYAEQEALSVGVYARRLEQLVKLLADSLAGLLTEKGALAGPLGDPRAFGLTVLAGAGLVLVGVKRTWLPLVVVLSMALLLPLVNNRYESTVPKARYLAPLLPMCYVGMALLLTDAFDASHRWLSSWRQRIARGAVVAIGLLVVGIPFVGLHDYYDQAQREGLTNAPLFRTIEAVQAARERPSERVTLDRSLNQISTLGGGRMLRQLLLAGAVYRWNTWVVDLPRLGDDDPPAIRGPLVVAASNERNARRAYVARDVTVGSQEVLMSMDLRAEMPADSSAEPRVLHVSGARLTAPTPRHQVRRRLRAVTEPFLSGLTMPGALAFAPDGRLFFTELLAGRIRIADGGVLEEEPFAVLPATKALEHGALGLTLDPSFADSHWVYVFYSEADAENRPFRNRVVRFTEREGRATETRVLLDDLPVNQTQFSNGAHNGGRIAFGPDGKLYVALGQMNEPTRTQDPDELYGKVLRINPDGSIPDDNPYPGRPAYALGLHNVWGMAFHPVSRQLYVADNGAPLQDLVQVAGPGHGSADSRKGRVGRPSPLDGAVWSSRAQRLGVTGMAIYDGSVFPEYHGDLFFCSLQVGGLRRLRLSDPGYSPTSEPDLVSERCRLDVANAPDGTLYFSDLTTIYRLAR
jgi:aldose sugar dehydrogenase